jgi:hypothetical protein
VRKNGFLHILVENKSLHKNRIQKTEVLYTSSSKLQFRENRIEHFKNGFSYLGNNDVLKIHFRILLYLVLSVNRIPGQLLRMREPAR